MKEPELIVVNKDDQIVGYRPKEECHDGSGLLHRATSIFLFNDNGEMLLQKRSSNKRLWPLHWSNACCSHLYKGENYLEAAKRRVYEELGLFPALSPAFKFLYFARFNSSCAEKECCQVFTGRVNSLPQVNQYEIAAWRFLSIDQLEIEISSCPENFTPWFHIEWNQLRPFIGNKGVV